MITKIQQMEHPLGVRFYKLFVDDFISGHIWCIAYKYKACVISSFAPTFIDCARICEQALGFSPNWTDCSPLVSPSSLSGKQIPTSYSQFTGWLQSISRTFVVM